jgi:hypothetical protein
MYTVFAPYSPFFAMSPPFPVPHWYQPHQAPDWTCSALLFSNFV